MFIKGSTHFVTHLRLFYFEATLKHIEVSRQTDLDRLKTCLRNFCLPRRHSKASGAHAVEGPPFMYSSKRVTILVLSKQSRSLAWAA